MKTTDITLPKKTVESGPTKPIFEGKIDDYIPIAQQLLTEAGTDLSKQSEAFGEICKQFAKFNDPCKTDFFLNALCEEFKIKKSKFNSGIKAAKKQFEVDSRGEIGDDTSPLINRVMKFIKERYDIFFNEIANKFLCKRKDEKDFRGMNIDNIYCELKKNHLSFSQNDLRSLLKSDFVPKINVFQTYFETLLPWDGEDYIGQLTEYIKIQVPPGSNEQDRFNRMFKKMLVRSIACSLGVGFNKQCFTLVHEKQNSGKSTFLRWLCPPALQDYYTESIGTSKDDLIALTENFIVNIDELSTLSKFDIDALKSVMSKDKIKVRLPYGERAEMLQRRCNFVASTNRMEFLNDETGSVRWVCFELVTINWDYNKDIDINKVWSQAYHLYKNPDYKYQLTPEEIQENENANRAFLIRSPEMDLIQKYLHTRTKEEFTQQGNNGSIKFMNATDIMTFIHGKISGSIKLSPSNVGKALTSLKFKRDGHYTTGRGMTLKGYYVEERTDNDTFDSIDMVFQPESGTLIQEKKHMANQTDLPY